MRKAKLGAVLKDMFHGLLRVTTGACYVSIRYVESLVVRSNWSVVQYAPTHASKGRVTCLTTCFRKPHPALSVSGINRLPFLLQSEESGTTILFVQGVHVSPCIQVRLRGSLSEPRPTFARISPSRNLRKLLQSRYELHGVRPTSTWMGRGRSRQCCPRSVRTTWSTDYTPDENALVQHGEKDHTTAWPSPLSR